MTSARAIVVVCIGLAAVVGGWITYKSATSERTNPQGEARAQKAKQNRKDADRQLGAMQSKPVGELASMTDVRTLLAMASATDKEPPAAVPVDALLDHVSEFISMALVNEDPVKYREWRAKAGYVPVPLSEMRQVKSIDRPYEVMTGKAWSDNAEFASTFDDLWVACRSGKWGGRVRAIIVDPKAFGSTFATLTLHEPQAYGWVSVGIGIDLWYGGRVAGYTSWWRPREERESLIRRNKSVTCAQVGFVVEYESGVRCPLLVLCIWVPDAKQWRIQSVSVGNCPEDGPKPMVY